MSVKTDTKNLRFFPAGHPHIQYVGRWDFYEPTGARHSWPGVYLIVRFTGRQVGVRLADDVNYYNYDIDGKKSGILHGNQSGASDYLLTDDLEDGEHELRFTKRNIVFGRAFDFIGVLVDSAAQLLPPPESGLKIEFIGDSFTAAEGNEALALQNSKSGQVQIAWEEKIPYTNIEAGFAVLVARHFKAQYHTICRSGIGMVCDWTGDRAIAMPKWYDRTLMELEQPKWSFQKWQPDLVVICLGLNDMSGLKDADGAITPVNSATFRDEYRRFIGLLREVYPQAKFLAVAAHPDWIRENVRKIVATEKATGRQDIYYCEFDYFPDGYLADGHPTVATHRKIAEQIIACIKTYDLLK